MALVEFRVETNIFSSHFLVSIKSVGIIVLGVQIHLTSLSSSYSFQITAFTHLRVHTDRRTEGRTEISAFIRTDRQTLSRSQRSHGQMDIKTDMARSTRLVILIKNIYTLCGRKRFLLPTTYFSPNTIYHLSIKNINKVPS